MATAFFAAIRRPGTLALFPLLLALAGCGGDPSGSVVTPPTATPTPSAVAVTGETRLLRGTQPVALLHTPDSVERVYGFDDSGARVDYLRGTDWQAVAGGIARMPGSRIPDFATYTYERTTGDRFEYSPDPRNPPVTLTYDVYVDYRAALDDSVVVARPPARATRRLLCLGDSIGAGAHTNASYYRDSDADSWCGLLRAHLGPAVEVRNLSSNDGTLTPIWADTDPYLAFDADTVVIAFGMNDHVYGESVAEFRNRLETVIGRFADRGTRVLLLGFFQQNELWEQEDPARTTGYNAAIAAAASSRGVPFLDVRRAFEAASGGAEPYYHLTGDFMHHPNSYAQRIYFTLLIPYFLDRDTRASAIPGYVAGVTG